MFGFRRVAETPWIAALCAFSMAVSWSPCVERASASSSPSGNSPQTDTRPSEPENPAESDLLLLPRPKEIEFTGGTLEIQGLVQWHPYFSGESRPLAIAVAELALGFGSVPTGDGQRFVKFVSIGSDSPARVQALIERYQLSTPRKKQAYTLKVMPDGIVVLGADNRGLFHGIQTLKQLLASGDSRFSIPCMEIRDWPSLEFRGIHFFTGRNALAEQKRLVDFMAAHKMNHIVLQVEHLEFKNFPELFHPERGQTREEMRELIEYARERYIAITPLVASLGHARWAFFNGHNLDIAEDPDHPAAFDVTNPRTYQFLFRIFDEVLELFEPEYLHLGLDEIDHFGRYPHRPETKKYTMTEILDLYFRRLEPYLEEKGIDKVMLWGDMFLARGVDAPDAAFAETPRDARARRAILHNAIRKGVPKEFVVCDWHYAPLASDRFTSLRLFQEQGVRAIASTWYNPENIFHFNRKAIEENALGLLQTTWAGFNFSIGANVKNHHQFSAYLLAADYSWSGRPEPPHRLPYNFNAEFWRRWHAPRAPGGTPASLSDAAEWIRTLMEYEVEVEILPVLGKEQAPDDPMIQYALTAKLSNPSDRPIEVAVRADDPIAATRTTVLPPGASNREIAFSFRYPREKATPASKVDLLFTITPEGLDPFEIAREAAITPVWFARPLPEAFAVDADLAKWASIEPYVYDSIDFISHKSNWTPEDITAEVFIGHDNKDLHLAFRVNDDVHFQDKAGGFLWQGDCVQLGFDFHYDRTPYYNNNDMEIGFALDNKGERLVHAWLSHFDNPADLYDLVEFAIRREEGITIYEIMIPLTRLGDPVLLERDRIGFTFTLSDNDGRGFDGGIIGSRGLWGGEHKRPHLFGTLVFSE